MESIYKTGDVVMLLDVPEILKENDSYGSDIGFPDYLSGNIFCAYKIEDVERYRGRNIYRLTLKDPKGLPDNWWVEENWITPASDTHNELDSFLDEW